MECLRRLGLPLVLVLGLTSCVKAPNSNVDPYEKYNRSVYRFNNFVDKVTVKPLAQLYNAVTPVPLQRGFSNVIGNIDEVDSMANDVLQLKLRYFFVNFWRFVINSTVGVGGVFDVASKLGLKQHKESLSLTLAYWSGGKESPYFMLPFLGPSTLRGVASMVPQFYMSPLEYVNPKTIYYVDLGGTIVTMRARLLPTDKLIEQAFDPYVFMRNAYMQRLRAKIARNQAEPHS